MYSQFSPRRVWDDIGWKTPPWNHSPPWDWGKLKLNLGTFAILHTLQQILMGYELKICFLDNTAVTTLMKTHAHHTLILINVFSLIAKNNGDMSSQLADVNITPLFIIIGWSIACCCCHLFTSSISDKESSNAYRMPVEHSLVVSLRVAFVSGVGWDPPSLT